jgi:integrase
MAREIEKLSPAGVRKFKKEGLYGDGAGLHVGPDAGEKSGKSWIFRFMLSGRAREMGLGALHTVGLAEARDRARACRLKLLDGVDPLAARDAERNARRLEDAKAITFKDAAEQYISGHRASWKNDKHAEQWATTLETYAYPTIGKLAVGAIDTGLVLKVLEPIWTEKAETANRLRGRIATILDWAKVRGYREGENPARWKGHLDQTLPARSKVAKVEHHAALPYAEMSAFMTALRAQDGIAARALEFAILTWARSGEVINARWPEIDFAEKVWTVPGGRMKSGREHRVPLAPRAIEILREMKKLSDTPNGLVFHGRKAGEPLSDNSMWLLVTRRMGRSDLTPHGFRSTSRDWAAERTSYPSEVAEMALAHAVGDKVEAAYRRGDLFQKRRQLAETWAKFCSEPRRERGNVVTMHRAGAGG